MQANTHTYKTTNKHICVKMSSSMWSRAMAHFFLQESFPLRPVGSHPILVLGCTPLHPIIDSHLFSALGVTSEFIPQTSKGWRRPGGSSMGSWYQNHCHSPGRVYPHPSAELVVGWRGHGGETVNEGTHRTCSWVKRMSSSHLLLLNDVPVGFTHRHYSCDCQGQFPPAA